MTAFRLTCFLHTFFLEAINKKNFFFFFKSEAWNKKPKMPNSIIFNKNKMLLLYFTRKLHFQFLSLSSHITFWVIQILLPCLDLFLLSVKYNSLASSGVNERIYEHVQVTVTIQEQLFTPQNANKWTCNLI